ncbi:nucleotidyltransferase family protein [Pseudomonas japonica]|uniref:nucleotidyltransferase family protein n=1 Tax=Pseudomonas japonica TaxID=256466 RepID=UPI00380419BC
MGDRTGYIAGSSRCGDHCPEAVRRLETGVCEVAAPLGVDDLFGLVIRPAGKFATEKAAIYQDRLKSKNWMKIWPLLTLAPVTVPPISPSRRH